MRLIHAVLAVLLIAGCADAHTLTRAGGTQAAVSLQWQASAYVAVPPDGRYEATLGGDHPQDLLPKPMSEYAASLFR